MQAVSERRRDRSRTVVHVKPLGVPFGAYRWRHHHGGGVQTGVVCRVGPLGHFQVQWFVEDTGGGRRLNRQIKLSFWGVSGRRRKRAVYVGIHW